MAILTLSGRAAMAAAIKSNPIHLAWGTGDPAWDTTPVPEPVDATALVAEVGRRAVTMVSFCSPSPTGEIQVPNGQFTLTNEITNNLYFRFNFDFGDAATATIRETAIFIGTQVQNGLPPGLMYFTPDQIKSPGILFVLERFPAFQRSPSVRQSFEFVVTL